MPSHPLDLIYDGKHDVQSVVGAGNSDSGGLIGQDTGQAPAKDLDVGHERVEMARECLARTLRHRIFGGRREALLDRNRRGIEHRQRVAAVASQRGAEIEEAVGIEAQILRALAASKRPDLRRKIFGVAK